MLPVPVFGSRVFLGAETIDSFIMNVLSLLVCPDTKLNDKMETVNEIR